MNDLAFHSFGTAESKSSKVILPETLSRDAKGMEDSRNAMEVLTRAYLNLAYSSHELVNLENLLMHVLAWQNDVKSVVEYNNISPEFVEKAMEFDLLNAILNSEVRELDNLMGTIQALVTDAVHKITSCGKLNDLFIIVESKLHDTEESLRQLQDNILEVKMQLAKLQMTSLAFNQNECRDIMLEDHVLIGSDQYRAITFDEDVRRDLVVIGYVTGSRVNLMEKDSWPSVLE
ncbi:hypothetical protein ACH5RR_036104 [Cinchona calisaya]|uniref:WIT1/2 N-terminal helical bundle domain-containing protein n=1 Tax=Cinchona calisaya TaxID=153742 RepID=A0ABD2Y771_9GENT